jgi:hypothetical protein
MKLEQRGQQVSESRRLIDVGVGFGIQRERREGQRSGWNFDQYFLDSTASEPKFGSRFVHSSD